MSVQRYDLSRCIGCGNCVKVCPMDVYRFNTELNKSIIAYPENCQSCAQCYVYCLGHSLAMSGDSYGYPLSSFRAATPVAMNRELNTSDNPKNGLVVPAMVGVLGAMFAHNALQWRRKTLDHHAEACAAGGTVERMNRMQRCQHLAVLLSFLMLVVTGFAMRLASAWMEAHLGFGRFLLKGVHLGAAGVLVAAGLFHLFYLLGSREGRAMLAGVFPRWQDVRDLFAALRHYLTGGGRKPAYGRFSYAEKAEYWMLASGTVTMGLTGLMMWRFAWAGGLLSDWAVSFARAWHFYEAVVAALAIVIWHMYQVFVDPDAAPMNFAWLSGRVPAEQYRREHALDTRTLPEQAAAPSESETGQEE